MLSSISYRLCIQRCFQSQCYCYHQYDFAQEDTRILTELVYWYLQHLLDQYHLSNGGNGQQIRLQMLPQTVLHRFPCPKFRQLYQWLRQKMIQFIEWPYHVVSYLCIGYILKICFEWLVVVQQQYNGILDNYQFVFIEGL